MSTSYSHCPKCGQQVIGSQFLCGHQPESQPQRCGMARAIGNGVVMRCEFPTPHLGRPHSFEIHDNVNCSESQPHQDEFTASLRLEDAHDFMTDKEARQPQRGETSIMIRVYRPEGYEDVCDELVMVDFAKDAGAKGWRYELV